MCLAHQFELWGEQDVANEMFDTVSQQLVTFGPAAFQLGFEIPGLSEDVSHVSALLRTPSGKISAKATRTAKEHLKLVSRCTLLQSLFTDTLVGMRLLAAAETILETYSSDCVGDKRIEMALCALRGDAVVRIVETKNDVHRLEMEELAIDGTVYNVLTDIIGHVLECRKIWSPSRACAAADVEALDIVELFHDVMFASHTALLGQLHTVYKFLFVGFADIPLEFKQPHFDAMQPIFKKINWTLNKFPLRLNCLKKFLSTYQRYVPLEGNGAADGWIENIFSASSVKEWGSQVGVLSAIIGVVEAISHFAGPHVFYTEPVSGTLDPQIYNNIAADTVGKTPMNFLTCSVNLLLKCKQLATSWSQLGPIDNTPFDMFTSASIVTPLAREDLHKLPLFLLDNVYLTVVSRYVQDTAVQVLDGFKEACEFGAMQNFSAADAEDGFKEMMGRLVDTGSMKKTLTAATSWLEEHGEVEPQWWLPVPKLLMLWKKIEHATNETDQDEIDASVLIVGGNSVGRNVLVEFMDYYWGIHAAMASFGYISEKLGSAPVMVNNKISGAFKKAVAVCEDALIASSRLEQSDKFKEHFEVERLDTFVPRKWLTEWCAKVGGIMPTVKAHACIEALRSLEPLVAQVENHTPSWTHIVTDTLYSKGLADQVIIKWAFVEVLEGEVGDLFTALIDIATMVSTWHVKESLEEADLWVAAKGRATTAANKGKEFLRVRAACNTVQHMRGLEQVDSAKALLTKGKIPDKLATALRGVIQQNGGANAPAFSNKRKADEIDSAAAAEARTEAPTPPKAALLFSTPRAKGRRRRESPRT